MALDKSTGPIPRDVFAGLVTAPYGQAIKTIRKFDPLYGLEKGEKINWRVECSGTITGTAWVKAASEEEATDLADKLSSNDVDWDDQHEDFEITSIEVSP